MAKPLKFVFKKNSWQAGLIKIDRAKIYGYVEDRILDSNGDACTVGNLLDDGRTLFLSGSTAIKTVDADNNEVDKKTLKAVYINGKTAELVPSSYSQDVVLEDVSLDALFDLEVTAVYQLQFDDEAQKRSLLKVLSDARVFRFLFNYQADYEGADAVMLATADNVFVLTGRLLEFSYLENKTVALSEEDTESAAEEDELIDFGML